MKKIRISINLVNILFSVLLIGSFLAFLIISYKADVKFNKAKDSIERYMACENSSKAILATSQFLYEQANLFVVTKNPDYATAFLNEKHKNENQKALKDLQAFCDKEDLTYKRLEIAIGQADNLSQLELYAIKLVYEANKNTLKNIPPEVENITLKETDKNLSAAGMEKTAMEILYGEGSLIYKQRITNNCAIILRDLETSITKDLEITAGDLGDYLHKLEYTQIHSFSICIFIFIIYGFWVFGPIKQYKNAMQRDSKIEPKGPSELIYLGETYNNIYDSKSNVEEELTLKSNIDALTDCYNRRAFDYICKKNSNSENKIALIIIDIDNFKSINETFGHSVGDKTLQHLAKCLSSTFRKDDFICRIGGDEFAIILRDFSRENKSAINAKMNTVRDKISSRTNEVPRFSISSGAAITENGYSSELYKQATGALYIIKNTGKNGCFVYSENV